MMRFLPAVILCCVLLFSCKSNNEDHLPRQKMMDIIADIHVAEVYSTFVNDSAHLNTNKNLDSLAVYYKTILMHHKVSMEEFQKSINWYSARPNELDTVYIGVLAEISTMEGVQGASPQ